MEISLVHLLVPLSKTAPEISLRFKVNGKCYRTLRGFLLIQLTSK